MKNLAPDIWLAVDGREQVGVDLQGDIIGIVVVIIAKEGCFVEDV